MHHAMHQHMHGPACPSNYTAAKYWRTIRAATELEYSISFKERDITWNASTIIVSKAQIWSFEIAIFVILENKLHR